MTKKRRKRHILLSRSFKIHRKQIRRAVSKKNWKYHHKKQIIHGRTEKKTVLKIKFSGNMYLADSKEHFFKKINPAKDASSVAFSFSDVKNVDVGSMLYIKAFVDYKKAQRCNVKISCSEKNRKMRQILQHMKLRDYGLNITFNDIKCWTVREWDENAHENYGKVLMNEILPVVLENKFPSEEFSSIASGLNELLSNCSEHAYTEHDLFKGYYLIAGEYDNIETGKSNEFSFCIIDMGQGFRSSLHKNTKFMKIIRDFGLFSDENLIKEAVDSNFNANKDKNSGRGTGLPAVKKSVEIVNGGLHIYSDTGTYMLRSGKERLVSRSCNIIGSIIMVSLPIN